MYDANIGAKLNDGHFSLEIFVKIILFQYELDVAFVFGLTCVLKFSFS